jgi:hypothetical protein
MKPKQNTQWLNAAYLSVKASKVGYTKAAEYYRRKAVAIMRTAK